MHGLYLTFVVIYEIVVVLMIIHVLMDNRQPAKTMAWALVIYFVPFVGMIFYLFFGVNTRRERLVSQRSMNQLTKRSMLEFVEQQGLRVAQSHKPMVDLFINQNLAMPFKDNSFDIYNDGYTFFPDLLAAIGKAKSHIHFDFYIFDDDALGMLIADALIDRAREGVEVRVIYDDVGCWNVSHKFFERMREEGIEVCAFLPVRFPSFTSKVNYRNHRKIIVIDGKVGFVGGMNIALRYVKGKDGKPWRDTMVKVEGSAVYGLQRAFLVDWYFVDRTLISDRKYYPQPLVSAPNNRIAQTVTSSPISSNPEIMQGYVRLILAARRYIYIESPYFLPNEPVLFALKTAALGGLDIRIIVPWKTDAGMAEWGGRSYLREMVEAGVSVYLYTGGFLHSKMLICDDSLVSCGSTNFDFRSFENNFESNTFIYDEDTALRFKAIFLDDQTQTVEFKNVERRMKPKFPMRLWESIARMLSPLF
jgi:cardiolipin synthase A/B